MQKISLSNNKAGSYFKGSLLEATSEYFSSVLSARCCRMANIANFHPHKSGFDNYVVNMPLEYHAPQLAYQYLIDNGYKHKDAVRLAPEFIKGVNFFIRSRLSHRSEWLPDHFCGVPEHSPLIGLVSCAPEVITQTSSLYISVKKIIFDASDSWYEKKRIRNKIPNIECFFHCKTNRWLKSQRLAEPNSIGKFFHNCITFLYAKHVYLLSCFKNASVELNDGYYHPDSYQLSGFCQDAMGEPLQPRSSWLFLPVVRDFEVLDDLLSIVLNQALIDPAWRETMFPLLKGGESYRVTEGTTRHNCFMRAMEGIFTNKRGHKLLAKLYNNIDYYLVSVSSVPCALLHYSLPHVQAAIDFDHVANTVIYSSEYYIHGLKAFYDYASVASKSFAFQCIYPYSAFLLTKNLLCIHSAICHGFSLEAGGVEDLQLKMFLEEIFN